MRQNKAYAKFNSRYDDVLTGRKWWSRLYLKWIWKVNESLIAKEVLEMLPDDFQGEILDVPIGTAVFTAEKYKNMHRTKILGVDFSQEMLDIANERILHEEIKNLKLQHGDVRELAFEDERFDIVFSMNGVHAFPPQKHKAFYEMYRVLKPGGLFLGSFYIRGERGITDWFVRNIFNKMGVFTPPHFTKEETFDVLKALYGENVVVKNHSSILIFKCVK